MSPRNKEEREWKDLLHEKKSYIQRRSEEAEHKRALRDFLRHQQEDDEDDDTNWISTGR